MTFMAYLRIIIVWRDVLIIIIHNMWLFVYPGQNIQED